MLALFEPRSRSPDRLGVGPSRCPMTARNHPSPASEEGETPPQGSSRWRRAFAFERMPGAIPELDGLRALAILLVLARHGSKIFDRPDRVFLQLGPWDASSPMANGWVGVDLFFVLSGFLIAHHIRRRWHAPGNTHPLRRYVQKRLLRIVPAYYAFLLLVVAGGVPGYAVSQDHLAWRTIYHLLFLQDYLPSNIVVAFWSLGVEEKFYLLAPLLVLPLAALPARRALALLALLFSIPAVLRFALHPGGSISYDAFFFHLRSPFHASFDGLVAGCACAIVVGDERARRWFEAEGRGRRLQLVAVVVLALLFLPAPLLATVGRFEAAFLGSTLALAFASLQLGLLTSRTALNRWLSAYPWAVISRLSYSLYLVHMVFMASTWRLLSRWPGFDDLSSGAKFALYFPVFCALSAVAALILHYAVERPFLRIKDRI